MRVQMQESKQAVHVETYEVPKIPMGSRRIGHGGVCLSDAVVQLQRQPKPNQRRSI